MSNLRVKCHPKLGILVGTDGHVLIPATKGHPAHWTLGNDNGHGYLQVKIDYKVYYIHRLVAETFLQYPIPKGYEVDHKDRCRSSNFLDNLRIVMHTENQRNTPQHDRVTEQGRTHSYDDFKKYRREQRVQYRTENRDKERERQARYRANNRDKERERLAKLRQAKRKTHRLVRFGDGKTRWVPHAEAESLLAIPLNQRIFNK